MPRRRGGKCPPGNLCIDNTLFILIIVLFCLLIYFISKLFLSKGENPHYINDVIFSISK